MKIELKNLKIFLPGSKETINFVADLYVNSVKTASVYNEGFGGNTNYMAYNGADEMLAKAEQYCKALPAEICKDFGEPFEIKMNLEHFIDRIVDKEVEKLETKKAEKKLAKDCEKYLCITKIPEGKFIDTYQMVNWKGRKITELFSIPAGIAAIEKAIVREMANGYRILNTNLPAELMAITKKQTA